MDNFYILKRLFNKNIHLRCFAAVLLLLPAISFSQLMNNGALIKNSNNLFVINADVFHQNDGNTDGSIANAGDFFIKGNWENNNLSGNVFAAGYPGWVHLNNASQNITGTTITHFNNLELAGTGSKKLVGVDTEIEDTLVLNNLEFDAGDKTVYVLASGTGVVTQTTGFVSSTNDGGLSRNTLSSGTYFFPVGSNTGTPRFRPVDITPNTASANTYKVRMANVDASAEGYDRTVREPSIGAINPNFYHRITAVNTAEPTDITLYYDEPTDGEFDMIAQWKNDWKNIGLVTPTSNYGLSGLTKYAHTDFNTTPFVLAEVIPSVFVANVFSPNGDGSNDILHVLGKGIEELQFVIYDRWGEKVFETTNINNGWDGTFRGKPMNIGVFVYFVKGKYKNGDTINKNGNVTLLR